MRNQMPTGMSWTAACPSSSAAAPEFPFIGMAYVLVDERLEVNGARLRDIQRVQMEQGLRVLTGISPIAPTAHKAANKAGRTGPYPWRQPV
jgi:hypothetical protein